MYLFKNRLLFLHMFTRFLNYSINDLSSDLARILKQISTRYLFTNNVNLKIYCKSLQYNSFRIIARIKKKNCKNVYYSLFVISVEKSRIAKNKYFHIKWFYVDYNVQCAMHSVQCTACSVLLYFRTLWIQNRFLINNICY